METWTNLDRRKIVGGFGNETSNLGALLRGVNLESGKVKAGNSVTFLTCDSWFNLCPTRGASATCPTYLLTKTRRKKTQVNLYHINYSQRQYAYYELKDMSKHRLWSFQDKLPKPKNDQKE